MKVKELVAALQDMDQELEVYSCCDHGQSPEKTAYPSVIYTDSTAHCLWDEFTSDPDYAEDEDYTIKAVLL